MRHLYHVDAFTTTVFTGNPAGVVYPADGLSEQMMQQIANELRVSETAFIFTMPEERVVPIRFFTPNQEVPLCSHATVASFFVLCTQHHIPWGWYTLDCKAGRLAIVCDPKGIALTQAAVEWKSVLKKEQLLLLRQALQYEGAFKETEFPVQVVSTGNPKVLVQIETKKALDSLAPDRQKLIALGNLIGTPGFYCYTLEGTEDGVTANARMFSPGSGVDEDPVTGNAAGALALYLKRHTSLLQENRMRICQGEAIGRKGYVDVLVDGMYATIHGNACTLFSTTLPV